MMQPKTNNLQELINYAILNEMNFDRKEVTAILVFLYKLDEQHNFDKIIQKCTDANILEQMCILCIEKEYKNAIYVFCRAYISEKRNYICTIWNVDDVYEIYYELCKECKISYLPKSEEENFCIKVLETLERKFDAEIGINWSVIRSTILMLYSEQYNKPLI